MVVVSVDLAIAGTLILHYRFRDLTSRKYLTSLGFRRRRGPGVCTLENLVGHCTALSADVVDALMCVVVEVVIEAPGR